MSQSTAQPSPYTAVTVYLLDANMLLRLAQPSHPMYPAAQAAILAIRARGDRAKVMRQLRVTVTE